jgi:hypothetical protein
MIFVGRPRLPFIQCKNQGRREACPTSRLLLVKIPFFLSLIPTLKNQFSRGSRRLRGSFHLRGSLQESLHHRNLRPGQTLQAPHHYDAHSALTVAPRSLIIMLLVVNWLLYKSRHWLVV